MAEPRPRDNRSTFAARLTYGSALSLQIPLVEARFVALEKAIDAHLCHIFRQVRGPPLPTEAEEGRIR